MVLAVLSKQPNVLFLEQTAPPSTSQIRAGTRKFARLSCGISGDGRSRSCNGPAVRIKVNKPKGENMIKETQNNIKTRQNQKKTIPQRKKQLAQPVPICTEGQFLNHCSTLPRIKLCGKIIMFDYFPVKYWRQRLFKAGEALFIRNSKKYLRKIRHNYLICCC